MISPQTQAQIHLLEMLAFPEWQKADQKERDRMTKELGQVTGQMILDDIERQVQREMNSR